MKRRILLGMLTVSLMIGLLAIGCDEEAEPTPTPTPTPTSTPTPTLPPNTVLSVEVSTAPVLDGQPEALWNGADSITIPVSGGANAGATEVSLKSVYTEDSVYFLAQWADPTESLRRMPWQKQSDGSWTKLTTSTTHQENTNYEDKLAFIWNIDDSIAGFNQQGCMVTCHAGEQPANSGFGSKYTANAGEVGDIWHWKGVRSNPVGYVDDQYVDSMRYDAEAAPAAGRHSDPKAGGGYANNQTEDGTLPAFGLPDNEPAPPYWILDDEKVAFDDASYDAGDEVPGIVVAPATGDRGDISGMAVYADGTWTLEVERQLSTGSEYDVRYDDLTKGYFFGIAVFDNAQVDHAWSSGVYELRFAE
jgi:hypothetical protein